MAAHQEGTVALPDGRRLGYAIFGEGESLLYCHGFTSSRLDWRLLEQPLGAAGVSARVIAIDRPGIGRSTFQAGRTFLDWPRDVTAVVDALGVKRFAVLGASGGAPYALACAHELAGRVTRVGIAVGMAPVGADGMRAGKSMKIPLMNAILRRPLLAFASRTILKQPEHFSVRMLEHMSPVDRQALESPETLALFLAAMRESFLQGGKANSWEAGLYRRPWGFELGRIRQACHLWYGGQDVVVPARAGRWLAQRLPESTFTLWEAHGHASWMVSPAVAEVVRTLAAL